MSPASTERVESAIKAILVPFLELDLDAVGATVNVEMTADQARLAVGPRDRKAAFPDIVVEGFS
jgi:hypothetical protein